MRLTGATAKDQAFNRLTPLFIQDVIDATRKEGVIGGFRAAPGVLGVGMEFQTTKEDQLMISENKYNIRKIKRKMLLFICLLILLLISLIRD